MENITETVYVAIIAACAAIIGAVIAGSISHFSNKKRNDFEARIEICKYREKWLEQLRSEIVSLNVLCVEATNGPLLKKDQRLFFENMSRITLLVSDTNPHYGELRKSMQFVMEGLIDRKDYGEEFASEFENTTPFIIVAKKILKEEWDEIQSLLHRTKKEINNAKNK